MRGERKIFRQTRVITGAKPHHGLAAIMISVLPEQIEAMTPAGTIVVLKAGEAGRIGVQKTNVLQGKTASVPPERASSVTAARSSPACPATAPSKRDDILCFQPELVRLHVFNAGGARLGQGR